MAGGISTLYRLFAITLPGTIQMGQIQQSSLNVGLDEMILSGDGHADASFVAAAQLAPVANFTTTAIKTLLTNVGIGGLAVASATPLVLYLRKLLNSGVRTPGATATHKKASFSSGIVIPRSISADLQGSTAQAEFHAAMDGTNAMVTFTDSALPADTLVSEAYVVGPMKYQGALEYGVQSLSIDFGIDLVKRSGDGDLSPSFIGVSTRQPSISLTTVSEHLVATTQEGVAITTPFKCFLKQVPSGGTRTANATAQHIGFTVNKGRISVTEQGGSHGDETVWTIRVTPVWDGTNAVVVINTAEAIS